MGIRGNLPIGDEIGIGDEEDQLELSNELTAVIRDELYPKDYINVRCDSRENERGDFVRTFGGLFYLGILLSDLRRKIFKIRIRQGSKRFLPFLYQDVVQSLFVILLVKRG